MRKLSMLILTGLLAAPFVSAQQAVAPEMPAFEIAEETEAVPEIPEMDETAETDEIPETETVEETIETPNAQIDEGAEL